MQSSRRDDMSSKHLGDDVAHGVIRTKSDKNKVFHTEADSSSSATDTAGLTDTNTSGGRSLYDTLSTSSSFLEKSLGEIVYEVKEDNSAASTDGMGVAVEEASPVSVLQQQLASNTLQSTPPMAAMALALTVQEWQQLGAAVISASTVPNGTPSTGDPTVVAATSDMTLTIERLSSLFLLRIVALVENRKPTMTTTKPSFGGTQTATRLYKDWSTTTICRTALIRKAPWPHPITAALISNIRLYVRRILEQYHDEAAYHNMEHAYHVTISANKLLDMMLLEEEEIRHTMQEANTRQKLNGTNAANGSKGSHNATARLPNHVMTHVPHPAAARVTFGLKADPLMHLALFFSAMIHDVDHRGVSNRQLVLEGDELALHYNDQSVAEQRSLTVAFSELQKPEFSTLRNVMFPPELGKDDYLRFRKTVINLVLCTDLASPERTQLVKSKWKEAFGMNSEAKKAERRKLMLEARQQHNATLNSTASAAPNHSELSPSSHKKRSLGGAVEKFPMAEPRRHQSLPMSSIRSPPMTSTTSMAVSDVTMDRAIMRQRSTSTTTLTKNDQSSKSQPALMDSYSSFQSDDDTTTTSGTDFHASGASAHFSLEDDAMDGVIQSGMTLSSSSHQRTNSFPPSSNPISTNKDNGEKKDTAYYPPPPPNFDGTPPARNGRTFTQLPIRNNNRPGRRLSTIASSRDGLSDDDEGDHGGTASSTSAGSRTNRRRRRASKQENQSRQHNHREDPQKGNEAHSKETTATEEQPKDSQRTIQTTQTCPAKLMSSGGGSFGSRTNSSAARSVSPVPTRRVMGMPNSTGNIAARRFSSSDIRGISSRSSRVRLGIRRSLDLTGDLIEHYSLSSHSRSSMTAAAGSGGGSGHDSIATMGTEGSSPSGEDAAGEFVWDPDEPDELKATVVLEHLLRAADVGPNLQGWAHMKKWSSRLFQELKAAHGQNRGFDPQSGWYEGQLTFLDSYVMPLARKLDEIRVFGEPNGSMFAHIVEENRERWIAEGLTVTEDTIQEWQESNDDLES